MQPVHFPRKLKALIATLSVTFGNLSERTPRLKKRVFITLAVLLILLPVCIYFFVGWNVRSNAHVTLSRAQRFLAEGKPDVALEEIDWLRWFEPDQRRAQLLAGECFFVKKDYPAAIKALAQISETSPDYRRASFALARSYESIAKLAEAERILKAHLTAFPDSQEAVTQLQWIYFNQIRLRELENLLERSLETCPNQFLQLYHLLNTEHKNPIAQESIKLLNRINEKEPGQPSIMRALGYCHWKLGEIEQAKSYLEAARKAEPENTETMLVLFEFYLELGELETVQRLLTELEQQSEDFQRQLQQDDRWLWLQSRLEQQQGKNSAALESIQTASRLHPEEIKYLQQEAMLLQALGKKAEAAEKFQRVKQLAASHRELYKIVSSGALESPDVQLAQEIAGHLKILGQQKQAAAWQNLVQQFQSRQPTPTR
ncbi:tetratricopeptide repeat protein [Gimesia algae]|uniref:Tetratricopeptide repeat protein n=1 Tax=Gimesia algae TaxID=2527971 RepID=A0A517VNE4_9PLAN|nr:tetratricopeptide repeat protein [Gimesia algae]